MAGLSLLDLAALGSLFDVLFLALRVPGLFCWLLNHCNISLENESAKLEVDPLRGFFKFFGGGGGAGADLAGEFFAGSSANNFYFMLHIGNLKKKKNK